MLRHDQSFGLKPLDGPSCSAASIQDYNTNFVL